MGVSASVTQLIADDVELRRVMERFCLTPRQIQRIQRLFLRGDADASEELTLAEFHVLFDTESNSPFLTHLFDVMDIDHNRKLTFVEFLFVISTFCCYPEVQMVKFAFDTFDRDRDGIIGQAELQELIGKLDMKIADASRTARRVMSMVDSDASNTITIDEFAEMNLKYPHLLWPAFRLQYRVQEQTLGLSAWKATQKKMRDKLKPREATQKKGCFGFLRSGGTVKPDEVVAGQNSPSEPSLVTMTPPVRKLNPDRLRHVSTRVKKLSVANSVDSNVMRSRQSSQDGDFRDNDHGHAQSASHYQSTRKQSVTYASNIQPIAESQPDSGGAVEHHSHHKRAHTTAVRGHSHRAPDHSRLQSHATAAMHQNHR